MAEIAERELVKFYKDGRVATVRVIVNAPVPRYDRKPGETEWVCLYRIAGLDEAVSEFAPGTDGVDAMENAFAAVGQYLDSLDPPEPLTWDGKPEHGFSLAPAPVR